jgi:alpha-L-rhamnosidase
MKNAVNARRARVLRLGAAVAVGAMAMAVGLAVPTGAMAAPADERAAPPWPAESNWEQYVQAPSSKDVRPVAVVSTSGDVTNAEALLDSDPATVATLTATAHTLISSPVEVPIPAVQARYVRLDVTKLGLPAAGDPAGRYTQLAELQVFGAGGDDDLAEGKPVAPSESIETAGWGAHFLTDGVTDSQNPSAHGWTSNAHGSDDLGDSSVWVTIDLGSVQSVDRVVLWPRTDTLSPTDETASFPVDYSVATSATDDQTASFATRQSVTDQENPPAAELTGDASIILDYGHDVGGYPTFDVSAVDGSPTLQSGYSETFTQITPTGDGVSPWASGDSKRYNSYVVDEPGRITNADIQGGQRYQQITLNTPGTLSLSTVGIDFTPYLGTPDTFQGTFESSSEELNHYWYDGAYTAQINQTPTGSIGQRWSTDGEALDVPGTNGGEGLLADGYGWSDYSVSFQTQIVANQAGWMVRGQDSQKGGYLIILGSEGNTAGAKNVLQQVYAASDGSYQTIANVTLPDPITTGSWHDVTEEVSGSTVTTFLDGVQVGSFDTNAFPAGRPAYTTGSFGFRQFPSEEARFRDLTVTGPDGELYADDLTDDSAIADFEVPGNNEVPLILDGAKRDRAVWSGDLAVEGPTLYYSTNTSEYIKGSLELLGSWAGANGYMPGSMPPQTPINPDAPTTTRGGYSANYSMYFVRVLAEYYQYTGDADFVKKEWPLVENQLAWNATLMGPNGLLVTDSATGADWDYYDGAKTGEVTAFNALYYKVLLDGADLAAVVGDSDLAAQYTEQAASVKAAINDRLFDSAAGVYKLSDTSPDVLAQDANALAIEFGIAPADKVQGILDTIKSQLWTEHGTLPFSSGYSDIISPFVSGFELNARFASDNADDAFQLLSNEWGPMIEPGDLYTGTFWENITRDGVQGGFNTNMSHGWSTMPTSALSKYVLGIQPVGAGYSTWSVKPHPGDLSWTKGQAPTPHGPIVVNWGRGDGDRFAMHVEAPADTTGVIAVPLFGSANDIQVNDTTVWSDQAPVAGTDAVQSAERVGDYVELHVLAGTFDISTAPGASVDPGNPGDPGTPRDPGTPGDPGNPGVSDPDAGRADQAGTGQGGLAATGLDAWPFVGAAVVLAGLGALLTVTLRRRSRRA